jgi:RNA polymerase sigma factor (sigma-70 family)
MNAPDPIDHLRLVGAVLNKYGFREYDEDDLKQDGMLALVRAARAYKTVEGKFSVYAYNAIRTELWRHVLQGNGPVTLKRDAARSYYKAKKAKRLGQPDGLSEGDRRLGSAVEATLGRAAISLDRGPIEDPELIHPDGGQRRVDDADELEVLIRKAGLTADHEEILLAYYGIGCEPRSTLELGRERGWTRSYIGMIVRRSLAKVRAAATASAAESAA